MSLATSNIQADLKSALALHQRGQLAEAEQIYLRILKTAPDHFDATHLLGVALMQLGRPVEGERLITHALKIIPNSPEALYNQGSALNELKRFDEALASYDKAIALKADYAEAFNNRGNILQKLKHFDEALASFDNAIALKPDYPEAFGNRGATLQEMKRFDEALASFDKAIALKPDYAEALNNRGAALHELKRFDEALASHDKAIAIKPDHADAFYNRGGDLEELKRFEEALASYNKAVALKPNYAEAFNNRGLALGELKRFDEALASCDKAIALKPDYVDAFNNRGVVLQELKRFDEALASYDKAIALKPDYADAFYNRGIALEALKRFDEALKNYETALAINPDHKYAFSGLANSALQICDWTRIAKLVDEIKTHVAQRKSIISCLTLLGYSSDAALQLKCAKSSIEDQISIPPRLLWSGTTWRHDRVRIAYLSADFHEHVTAYLMAELFELHDRSRFEVLGVSFGSDDKSDMRSRLIKSFDQFHEVRFKTDREVAKLLNELQVDIAVDLKGYTQNSRLGILAHRPAPIQVNYLGYPGTIGADFVDYVIADEIVLPFDQQPYYTEKIVYLPDCYQVNDSRRKIANHKPTRQEAGLPARGFVFCCFNNNYKITAPVFDVWMRLLQAIDGSVLWLLRDNNSAEINLRKEAAARGIDPARLVFANRMPLEDHLARHRFADLFLDTLPYNAHTTASDALWTGLPIVTCCGESFAGRVAASLLSAVGLPELVTSDLEEYQASTLKLARDASFLASIKAKLTRNRDAYPLFNTKRFTRHLESTYTTMWEIWQRGGSPRSFSVRPEPDTGVGVHPGEPGLKTSEKANKNLQ
jgi:predicted O-linked N-acetylglucosamine transferase (SPINDLY family)